LFVAESSRSSVAGGRMHASAQGSDPATVSSSSRGRATGLTAVVVAATPAPPHTVLRWCSLLPAAVRRPRALRLRPPESRSAPALLRPHRTPTPDRGGPPTPPLSLTSSSVLSRIERRWRGGGAGGRAARRPPPAEAEGGGAGWLSRRRPRAVEQAAGEGRGQQSRQRSKTRPRWWGPRDWDGESPKSPRECSTATAQLQNAARVAAATGAVTVHHGSAKWRCRRCSSSCSRQS
jgi:hypothetical protein